MMRLHPTVEIPQWPPSDDPTANSPYCIHEALTALQRYLPSNEPDNPDIEIPGQPDSPDTAIDAYSCDHFRMYEFKVRRCVRGRSHDWTECPYAHPGEKARRRDPRKYNYSGTACPDFRKGSCKKGEACEFAHGVFECWLHPSRYRTQPCKDGANCRRRVCFFAHSADQLRVLNNSSESISFSSPLKAKTLSYRFTSPSPPDSPPESPMKLSRSLGSSSMSEVLASLRSLQLGGKETWGVQMGGSPVYGSPRGGGVGSMIRPGFRSLPTTPTQCVNSYGRRGGVFDSVFEEEEEEPVMERVESGRDLRMKMFERISKGSSLERVDPDPDVEWVSDLVN